MADRTTDRTRAAVDASAAEPAAEVTAALPAAEATSELTVPLAVAEATAELTVPLTGLNGARPRKDPKPAAKAPAKASGKAPAKASGKAPAKAPARTAAKAPGKTTAAPADEPSATPTAPAKTTAKRKAPAKAAGETTTEATGEITAPLSTAEIAAALAEPSARADEPVEPADATSPEQPEEPEKPASAEPAGGTDPATTEPGDSAEPDPLPGQLPVPARESGDRIAGRYRLDECFTQTEAFSSWRAVDEKLRRAVGVHLLAAGNRRADEVVAAARSAALLGDPRFVQVLDAVQEGELVYVVREWLPDATDLATLLADGPLEPYEAYQMVRQVTEAIAAAHRAGRSHLRLTPRAVLRTDTGQYRINGVAVDAALRGGPAPADRAAAELADTRAIGDLLYAALTHRWPHPEDRYKLTGLPGDDVPPPTELRAQAHPELAELAARILCETGSERLSSPAALAKAIGALPRIRQPAGGSAAGSSAHRYPAPGQTVGRTPAAAPATVRIPAAAPAQVPPRPRPPQPNPGYRPGPARPPQRAPRRAAKVLRWTVSVVLLAAIGYGSWQLAGKLGATSSGTQALSSSGAGGRSSAPASPLAPTPLPITNVTSFNPSGTTQNVHGNTLPLTHDGDPTTAWSTESYDDDLTAMKHGTGLIVDLGAVKSVNSVEVLFLGGTTGVELRVPTATGDALPTQLTDFGQPIATASSTDAQFKLAGPVHTRYLLIWLTSLPKDDSGKYRGQVAEIKVAG
ncbi:serine/threonine protein kinase [Kitasatospora viridis]|uniref:F5/8 type C domain-containing protein n=1 Tax=Kitasatospora viridis TaxID=281105 RepID=A0A561UHH6_9ACTN|nr:serine/threonine protein kinase [Kitasatospora viridis]TWF98816.1 hypothetical protein FHX73_112643 [Kitasatospora viridis]